MTRALAIAALALGLAGCPSEGPGGSPGESADFEVECVGMAIGQPYAGYYVVGTRFLERCRSLVSDTIWDPAKVDIIDNENFREGNTMTLQIFYAGDTWVSRSGTISLTTLEDGFAEGTFDILADTSTGRQARIKGPISWCNYGQRTDCPYQSTGGLTKRISWTSPGNWNADPDLSLASDCRTLINRTKKAVQVDFQIGVFKGINVGRWADQCQTVGGEAMNNRFTFRAAEVDGPGTYGPTPSVDFGDLALPGFSLNMPLHFFASDNACLTDYARPMTVSTTATDTGLNASECSWTITETSFALSCTQARHYDPIYSAQGVVGDFELEVDCDLRYVD